MMFGMRALFIDEMLSKEEVIKVELFFSEQQYILYKRIAYDKVMIYDIFDDDKEERFRGLMASVQGTAVYFRLRLSKGGLAGQHKEAAHDQERTQARHKQGTEVMQVALGLSGEQLAVNFLADICKGNGQDVPDIVSCADKSATEVVFIKPLMDLLKKEVRGGGAVLLYDCWGVYIGDALI